MRRAFKFFWRTFALLCLFVCAASAFMWVRSQRVEDYAFRDGAAGSALVFSSHGSAQFLVCGAWPGDGKWSFASEAVWSPSAFSPALASIASTRFGQFAIPGLDVVWGSGWASSPQDRTIISSAPMRPLRCVVVRWAWPAILFALPSVGLGLMKIHRVLRPRPRGVCPTCGYDLRATPDRCPECGTPALPKEACVQSALPISFDDELRPAS